MSQKINFLKPNSKQATQLILNQTYQDDELIIAFIGKSKETYDLKTLTHHQTPQTQSYTMIRGVLLDQSQAQIEGIIKIDKSAQQTRAFLEEKILLAGKQSKATAQPQLEIEANDVKASHAATVAKLDQEQLFYLMSRGLNQTQAQQVLIRGFLQPVIDRVQNKIKKKQLIKAIKSKLLEA